MPEETAIKVSNVSKDFILPHDRVRTVKGLFTSFYKRHKKTREVQHALKNITFDIKRGEFFGIVGRNGSGKSTLLKILAAIYQPTNGSVEVHGKLVPFIELGVGFNDELTGRENVYLNGAMLGFSKRQIDSMYDDIVAFAEITRFMDQKLKNYSSGMKVRLAFSLATRAQADILLVDEVLAVGDADFQRKCFEYFRTLKRNKKTVVFVSHDMSAVREYCDRVIMIEKSRLVHQGDPDAVATEYIKLFNTENAQQEGDPAGRWGTKAMTFGKIAVAVDAITITIDMPAKARRAINDPVFGFLLRDSAGNDLFGNNSKVKHVSLGSFQQGDQVTVRWQLPNVLNDGTFTLTAAITEQDGVTQSDWWENAITFTVFREDKIPYSINPPLHVKVIR